MFKDTLQAFAASRIEQLAKHMKDLETEKKEAQLFEESMHNYFQKTRVKSAATSSNLIYVLKDRQIEAEKAYLELVSAYKKHCEEKYIHAVKHQAKVEIKVLLIEKLLEEIKIKIQKEKDVCGINLSALEEQISALPDEKQDSYLNQIVS